MLSTAKPQPFTPQQSRHGCQPPESSIKAMLILSTQKYTMQPQQSAALCKKETTRVLKRARASLSRGQGKQRGLKGSLGSKTQLSTQNAAQRPQLYTEQGTQSLLRSVHPRLAGSKSPAPQNAGPGEEDPGWAALLPFLLRGREHSGLSAGRAQLSCPVPALIPLEHSCCGLPPVPPCPAHLL